MRFKHLFFTIVFCILVTVSAAAQALEVRNVRFGQHQDKVRLVLDLNESVDFQAFMLADPYRMVIDLPVFAWTVPGVQNSKTIGIAAIRHGVLKPGISRIVFDLDRSAAIKNAFTLPGETGKGGRLVVDFAAVPPGLFAQARNKVYGTLNTGALRTAPPQPPPVRETHDDTVRKPLVVIDPGHGGVDPGAIGKSGLKEKNIVLALARALKKELEGTGRYRVQMTRETDIFIKLRDRVSFARKAGADLFVSIHADSVESRNVHGASVYSLSEKASDAQTAKLAARENKADLIAGLDLSTEDEDVVSILVDLARRDTMNQSKFFAGTLVETLPGYGVTMLERPHRFAGFAVLKAPDIPSILIEAGFISNAKEAERLNSNAYRMKVVRGLKKSIDAYFEQVRKNRRE